MYLVYEKNYLSYGDVDCVEQLDMKLSFIKTDDIPKAIVKIVDIIL